MPSLIRLLSLVIHWLDPAHFKRGFFFFFTLTIPCPLVTDVDVWLHLLQQTGADFKAKEV